MTDLDKHSGRKILKLTGAGVIIALAGCTGSSPFSTDNQTKYPQIEFWSEEQQAERKRTIGGLVDGVDTVTGKAPYFSKENRPTELAAAPAAGDIPTVGQVQAQTI